GGVAFHAWDRGEQRGEVRVGGGRDARGERVDCLIERVDVGGQAGDQDAVVWGGAKRVARASVRCGSFARHLPLGSSASAARAPTPASSASSIARAEAE